MNHQEILTRVIEKAIANGWTHEGLTDEGTIHYTETGIVVDWLRGGRTGFAVEAVIFNHDFAKALWGEEYYADDTFDGNGVAIKYIAEWSLPEWQYRLQQMVIANDPIKYLGDNL